MVRFRTLFVTLAFSFCIALASQAGEVPPPAMTSPVVIDLWAGSQLGSGGHGGAERISASGAVSNITRPRIEVYRPAHPNGAAVILMGGGGYVRIGIGHEVMPTARWLAGLGVTPVVLYYRLPGDHWPAQAPFQDAQRAVRVLRAHASALGIDPGHVGVIGFSAGGNLAAITETRFTDTLYPPTDTTDRISARPDFAGLIYPVISLQAPYDTTHAGRELSTQADASQAYSAERHVSPGTPPTFLAQAADDPISNIGNSRVMYAALKKNGVKSELHVFDTGGHGWGMGEPGSAPAQWPALFASWAKRNGFWQNAE